MSRAFRKVVAYPLGCIEEVILNLLNIGVDALGWLVRRLGRVGGGVGRVEKRTPRDDGLIHVIDRMTKCLSTWHVVREVLIGFESTEPRLNEVEGLF